MRDRSWRTGIAVASAATACLGRAVETFSRFTAARRHRKAHHPDEEVVVSREWRREQQKWLNIKYADVTFTFSR